MFAPAGALCLITMDGERKFVALQFNGGYEANAPLYIADCVSRDDHHSNRSSR